MTTVSRFVLASLFLLPLTSCAPEPVESQVSVSRVEPPIRKSQGAFVSQHVAGTQISVTYFRPVARGRKLFGDLVPYGKLWTPGANDATVVQVSHDVRFEGNALPAGTYSLWTIPSADSWTVILNKMGKAYHLTYPGEASDALRCIVPKTSGPSVDLLTFDFPAVEAKTTLLQLRWGDSIAQMAIEVQ